MAVFVAGQVRAHDDLARDRPLALCRAARAPAAPAADQARERLARLHAAVLVHRALHVLRPAAHRGHEELEHVLDPEPVVLAVRVAQPAEKRRRPVPAGAHDERRVARARERRGEHRHVLGRAQRPELLVAEERKVGPVGVQLWMERAVHGLDLGLLEKQVDAAEGDERRLFDGEAGREAQGREERGARVEVEVLRPRAVEVGVFGVVGGRADVRE